MRSRFCLALPAIAAVSACTGLPPSPTIVTAFNGNSVTISQANLVGEGYRSAATDSAAARICSGEEKKPEYASGYYQGGMMHHLYLCV